MTLVPNPPATKQKLALGLDFGTSGARACLLDPAHRNTPVALHRAPYAAQTPGAWRDTLCTLLDTIQHDNHDIGAICVDGTSATTLLVDAPTGTLVNEECVCMYNQAAPVDAVEAAVRMAGSASTPATAPTSALPKLLAWVLDGSVDAARDAGYTPVLCHQADWIAGLAWTMLMGDENHALFTSSSYNNCLKLGYDVRTLTWPSWLTDDPAIAPLLPQRVVAPGDVLVQNKQAVLCAGTTDSIAAFLASGASAVGDAVTSLGSTLALKLISQHPIADDAARGLYCHRLGDTWLVGGASSSGCAVLRERWTDEELVVLEEELLQDGWVGEEGCREVSLLHGHTVRLLPKGVTHDRLVGGNNSHAEQQTLEESTANCIDTLYAMLHGIASIEARAYTALSEAGSSPVTRCFTAGGGAKNEAWRRIRQHMLGVPVTSLMQPYDEAAYGCALLAAKHL